MLTRYQIRTKLLKAAAVGLLAGCAWLSTGVAIAQDQNQGQRSDAALQSGVSAALARDSALNGQQIAATAANGVVTLNGTVQTTAQRQKAETDAANVSGVSGIMNNLKVTNPGAAASSDGLEAQSSANQLAPQDQNQNPDQSQNQGQYQNQPQDQNSVPPPPPDENQPPDQEGYPQQQYPQQQNYPQQPYPPQGYPQQQGYPPPQGGYPQQSYAPPPQQVPYYATPTGPVTIPAGRLVRVRLNEPLDTAHLKDGTIFQATAAVNVYQNGVLAIPRGAVLTGQVVQSKEGGPLGGSAILRLQLTNLELAGKTFPITSDVWSSKGPNKAGYTAANTAGGALVGALIGGIIGRGAGAAIGAGVGAAGGLAASSATNGPRVYLPAEAAIDFHLADPVTVQPVSWQEAQRLASSVPDQPTLVRRPRPVYVVPGPYYGPYPYAYPYPY